MKTFNKNHLPDKIEHNGRTYTVNIPLTTGWGKSKTQLATIAATLRKEGRYAVLVKVLHKGLKGKTDLHNKPYEPTQWIYTTK